MTRYSTICLSYACTALMFAAPAVADVLRSGSGTGFGLPLTNPIFTGQINVGTGSTGNPGELEVNAESLVNGFTAFESSGLLVGEENGGDGVVRVIGDGTPGSATVTVNDGIGVRIGVGGNGLLEVRSGGVVSSNEPIHFGEDFGTNSQGNGTVIVDGPGSVIRSSVPSNADAAGRIAAPFDGQATSNITISNGGVIEATGGDLPNFDAASIFLGGEEDFPTQAIVNVTGEGSTLQASHFIGLRNGFGGAQVNVSDGATMRQLEAGLDFGDGPPVGIGINSFDADTGITVSGVSAGSVASSLSAVDDISVGIVRRIIGFTASGEPRVSRDFDTLAGDPILDQEGNPLFDALGNPVIGVENDFFGDGSFVFIEPDVEVFTKQTGYLIAEDGAVVETAADITISENSEDPLVTPSSGEDSTLTVRNGGTVNAQNVRVREHGRLDGGGGNINANVFLEGGALAPGNSIGTLTVDGDINLLDGILQLEFGAGGLDMLLATGEITLGPDLVIELVLNQDPAGQTIDLNAFFSATELTSNFNFQENLILAGLGNNATGVVTGFDGETLLIPEPGSLVLCTLSAAMLIRWRRPAAS
ncbi:MAG: hypothetical protein AAF823_11705 [Planctomycetota bacterium]